MSAERCLGADTRGARNAARPQPLNTLPGFIEDTLAEDGDPLDALVLVWEPTFPGCLIEATPVGLFDMYDEKGKDEKILCVPVADPMWRGVRALDEVPAHLLREIEHFFSIYKDLEEKEVRVEGWDDREAALRVVKEARERYRNGGRTGS